MRNRILLLIAFSIFLFLHPAYARVQTGTDAGSASNPDAGDNGSAASIPGSADAGGRMPSVSMSNSQQKLNDCVQSKCALTYCYSEYPLVCMPLDQHIASLTNRNCSQSSCPAPPKTTVIGGDIVV